MQEIGIRARRQANIRFAASVLEKYLQETHKSRANVSVCTLRAYFGEKLTKNEYQTLIYGLRCSGRRGLQVFWVKTKSRDDLDPDTRYAPLLYIVREV